MIDIHCHILPDIDDGPADVRTSLRMLKMAADDGITHVVATPHFRYREKPNLHDIEAAHLSLQLLAEEEKIPVTLLWGGDVRISFEMLEGLDRREVPAVNGSRYLLLELPDLVPPRLADFLFEIRVKGYVPIITHPERNYGLLSSPEKTGPLREAGALFQVTAMSITGDFGPPVKKMSLMLLKEGYIDIIASDAHNLERRVPVLSKAFRAVAKAAGPMAARRLCLENPLAVIEDREII